MDNQTLKTGTRIGSMIIDHFIMTAIAVVFFIPSMIKNISAVSATSHERPFTGTFGGPLYYIGLLGFALYFCKDCINGRSFGKRITKLQVVDNTTEQVASPIKCFIRNIFIIIWPIEVIVALINPGRRIGDRVAGTKIIPYDPNKEVPKINFTQVLISLCLAIVLLLLICLALQSLTPKIKNVEYIESSYNEKQSKELEKICIDSIGQYVTPSIKVYDKIEGEPNLKYVSAIYYLKDNYFADENIYKDLVNATLGFIANKMPGNTFSGYCQYLYKDGNRVTKREFPINPK